MTDAQFDIYVRSLINEDTAAFWKSEEMAVYKLVALTLVNGTFWNLLAPLKKWPVLYSLAAGENILDLPVGWHKVIRVEVASTGQPLKPVPDQEIPDYLSAPADDPAGYIFVRGKVRILPDSGSARADYIRLWYLPRATTLADLPEDLHPLVAIETVLAARTKDENVSPALLRMRDRFEWVARKALVTYQAQAPLSIPDDYDMGD